MERITTSKKIEFAIIQQGRNKKWLSEQLEISRPTLYKKISDNIWTTGEILKLKTLGLL